MWCPCHGPWPASNRDPLGASAVRGDEGLAERGTPVQDVAAGTAAGDHARVEQHPQVVADSADRQAAGRRQVRRAKRLVEEAHQRRAVGPDQPVKAAAPGGVARASRPATG